MSAERIVRRSVLGAMGLRMLGEAVAGVGAVVITAGKAIELVADPLMYLEADLARRYEALTGVDLGCVVGYPGRYDEDPEQFVTTGSDEEDDDE